MGAQPSNDSNEGITMNRIRATLIIKDDLGFVSQEFPVTGFEFMLPCLFARLLNTIGNRMRLRANTLIHKARNGVNGNSSL